MRHREQVALMTQKEEFEWEEPAKLLDCISVYKALVMHYYVNSSNF